MEKIIFNKESAQKCSSTFRNNVKACGFNQDGLVCMRMVKDPFAENPESIFVVSGDELIKTGDYEFTLYSQSQEVSRKLTDITAIL